MTYLVNILVVRAGPHRNVPLGWTGGSSEEPNIRLVLGATPSQMKEMKKAMQKWRTANAHLYGGDKALYREAGFAAMAALPEFKQFFDRSVFAQTEDDKWKDSYDDLLTWAKKVKFTRWISEENAEAKARQEKEGRGAAQVSSQPEDGPQQPAAIATANATAPAIDDGADEPSEEEERGEASVDVVALSKQLKNMAEQLELVSRRRRGSEADIAPQSEQSVPKPTDPAQNSPLELMVFAVPNEAGRIKYLPAVCFLDFPDAAEADLSLHLNWEKFQWLLKKVAKFDKKRHHIGYVDEKGTTVEIGGRDELVAAIKSFRKTRNLRDLSFKVYLKEDGGRKRRSLGQEEPPSKRLRAEDGADEDIMAA